MSSLRYRPEIDGLRAIAVAVVVIYHADPRLLPGGFVGVDVFFVISGYLITSLLATEWVNTGRLDFAAFYARRVRRLLPAMTALVLVVMVAAVVLLGRYGEIFEQTGASAAASLLFVANVYFQLNSGGYLNGPVESMPLLHLWSLSVEEQYYLAYPALLLLLMRFAPGGVKRRLVALSVLSLLLAEYWVHAYPERAFYQMPARFWELAVGGLVALSAAPAATGRVGGWLMPAGLAMIAATCGLSSRWSPFPGIGAMPAVVGAALVLLAVHRQQVSGPAASLLRSRPFVALGLISYSLYLWHWPLLAFDYTLRIDPAPRAWRLLLCMLAVGLAWLSWRFVETPFRRGGGAAPRRVLLAGAGVTVVALAAVLGLARLDSIPAEARRMAALAREDVAPRREDCNFAAVDPVEALKPAACRSQPGRDPAVALWGDSHAFAWQPFAWRIADAAGESAAGATMDDCPPAAPLPGLPTTAPDSDCSRLNALALQWLASGRVATVVVATRWPRADPGTGEAHSTLASRIAGLDAALGRLGPRPRVLVMGPLPLLKQTAPICISTGRERACAYTRAQHEAATAAVWQQLQGLAARHPNVNLVDATDFFCDRNTCPVARDGYALYSDDDHISATAAREFANRYLAEPARYTRRLAGSASHPPPES